MALLLTSDPKLLKPARARSQVESPLQVATRPAVVVIEDPAQLADHVSAWEDLARAAIEPNPFYEPWMMLPAIEAFAARQKLLFVLVYLPDPARPREPPRLCGFFPLERRRFKKLPVKILGLWQHLHCFCCTPLIRAQGGPECLAAFLHWAGADRNGAPLIEFNFVTADGPIHQLLVDHFLDSGCLTFVEECFTRALFRPNKDAESYLGAALSTGIRKEYRRQRKRLGEMGRLEAMVLEADGNVDHWLDQFLELEAAGWKGQERTALGSNPVEQDYFRQIARMAFERGRLMMLGLFLDDRPVAMKCNFLSGSGAFAFKIAYDERYARFSPGVQLELDNIQCLHQCPRVQWMDSCAVARHSMINRLWSDRRVMQTVLISTRGLGDLLVSLRPMVRWLGRLLRKKRGVS